jgi:hypothetical protein
MAIDPKHIITLPTKAGPKEFILHAGLLDAAHQSRVREIQTEEVLALCLPEKDHYVVRATGRFRTEDGEDAVWSAMGDANPSNSQMRGAYLRHAETRAVNRMLRFATNIGMTSLDEMGDLDAELEARALSGGPGPVAAVREPGRRPDGATPTAPLPVARHSPGTVGTPPAPGGETPRPVVGANGAEICYDCGQPVNKNAALISQHKFSRILCPNCQRTAASEAHTKIQSANA